MLVGVFISSVHAYFVIMTIRGKSFTCATGVRNLHHEREAQLLTSF